MRNIKLIIEYDGSAYHGWQMQDHALTIQQVVEEKLYVILREKVRLNSSGRTDAGVHAFGQVVNFKTETVLSCERIFISLNGILPDDVAIRSVEDVPDDFDARRSATSKIYRYVILNRLAPTALERHRCWHLRSPLDIDLMRKAAAMLLGEHDFSVFRGSGCTAKHPLRRMLKVSLEYSPENSDVINFEIEGQAFLKHMVRNIVGTLVAVGRGEIDLNSFKDILDSKDRTKAGVTAPPQGLFMLKVKY